MKKAKNMVRCVFIDAEHQMIAEKQIPRRDLLRTMQAWVGGCIEIAGYLRNGDTLFVSDSGLLDGLDFFFAHREIVQPLAGNGVIVGGTDDDGESLSAASTLHDAREAVRFLDGHAVHEVIAASMPDGMLMH